MALICACLSTMRNLFKARVGKMPSYLGASRLGVRKYQPDGSSNVELSPASCNPPANESPVPLSPISLISSEVDKSYREGIAADIKTKTLEEGEKTQVRHYTRAVDSMGSSDPSNRENDMKPASKTLASETGYSPKGASESPWPESGIEHAFV